MIQDTCPLKATKMAHFSEYISTVVCFTKDMLHRARLILSCYQVSTPKPRPAKVEDEHNESAAIQP